MSILVKGGFEPGELAFLKERVMPGSVAFDVGANVGIHAVYMADAAGRMGSVYAFEPDPETAERMQAHLKLNGINNVIIMAKGVGASEGLAKLIRGCDAAYNRIVPTAGTTNVETPELVEISTLDAEWERLGRPVVSIIKIDAEGGELGVVQGATQLLKDMRPMLLVEANTAEAFERLDSFLSGYGYVASRPAEFEMWNHLFVHASRGQ